MRKRKPLIVTGIVVFALVSIVCYYIWPRNIDKYYYGYCVDLNSGEIIDNCNINGKYIKCAVLDIDFKKIIGEFNGRLTINDLSYELYGANGLNDENEYFTDKQGNKRLGLTASEHCKAKYGFGIYREFNDKEVLIRNLNDNEVIIASNRTVSRFV
ncbi:MAG: hypothetical protein E7213_04010 [Clostridium sp.]|nr:hypothetical protein [Clostridium sp.]